MEQEDRTSDFQRNMDMERLLQELNDVLDPANQQLLNTESDSETCPPTVFIFGAPRSGTTLFMQWLAATGLCAYPSNLLSRFYSSPLIGAKIQKLLTDPAYAFRDELFDLQSSPNYVSENGKTSGALSPNEFWYFWRRFGFGENNDFVNDHDLRSVLANNSFKAELSGLAEIFNKPFALKAIIANQHIDILREVFEKSIFVWIRRSPEYNIQSLLEARRRQHGSLEKWYSFQIREFPELHSLEPLKSVAGQIYYTNKAIADSFELLPNERKLVSDYEEFCKNPGRYYDHLKALLAKQGVVQGDSYSGPRKFQSTNQWYIPEYDCTEVLEAYDAFSEY
jgi:hypothetical protein